LLQTYFFAWLGVLAAQATPGPNMMTVASAGLAQGRSAALFVVSGIVTGVFVWTALVAGGLGALFAAQPALLTVLKFVGGGYLVYLGLRAILAALRGTTTIRIAPGRVALTPAGAWRRGLVVVMLNPKGALMWSAVATVLFGSGLGALDVLAFGPIAALSAALIYGAYGLLFSSQPAIAAYARFSRWIEGVFGLAFGALGVALLADGIRSLRT